MKTRIIGLLFGLLLLLGAGLTGCEPPEQTPAPDEPPATPPVTE